MTDMTSNFRRMRRKPENKKCSLSPNGSTYTLNEIYDWANAVVASIRTRCGATDLSCGMYSYRNAGFELLSFNVSNSSGASYPMTFLCGEPLNLRHISEPYVPDMVEAIHMVGILSNTLQLTPSIGSLANETNKYCGVMSLVKNQDAASLNLN